MLPSLIPAPALLRASSQLARRAQTRSTQPHYSHRRPSSSSTFIPHLSHTARHEQDVEDQDDAASTPPRRHHNNTAFSHFFDKRTPPSISSRKATSTKPRASHEIVSASRNAVTAFRHAVGTRDPASIIDAYHLLIQAQRRHAQDVRNSSSRALDPWEIGFPVRKTDIQTAVLYLVKHSQGKWYMPPRHVEACHQMFNDMTQLFGFRIAPTDLHRKLQTFCLSENPKLHPCEAFDQLRANHPDWQANSSEWGMVIAYLEENRSYDDAIKLWNQMRDAGVEVWDPLRHTMIKVFLAVNNTDEADALRQQLAQDDPHIAIDFLTSTVEGLCNVASTAKQSNPELMRRLRTHATDLRKAVDSIPQLDTDSFAWQALLRYDAIVAGPAHAPETARKAGPGLFGYDTLCMLLRLHADELNDLQSSDDALELLDRIQSAIDPKRKIQLDDQCYNILMLALLNTSSSGQEDGVTFNQGDDVLLGEDGDRGCSTGGLPSPNQVREAQLLYDQVRALGVPPTPLLVKPLLTAYCEAFLPSLPSAMKLVQDLLDYANARNTTSSTRRKSPRSPAISMAIVHPVLDACVKLKDLTCARDLLSRLHDAGIALEPAHKLDLISRLIRIATSWTEVFHVYRTVSRFPSSTSSSTRDSTRGLDERGYITLLRTLRTLSFPSADSAAAPAPPESLLGIVHDMRAAGHPPSCATYTAILDYYAKATPEPSSLGVQLTHEMLKRDAGLEPDLPLINALMNAYNRVDEPAMVLAIWDSLMATRQEIDGVTLSVFFDTAGRHGLLALARRAVGTVRRVEAQQGAGRTAMTKGAWDSWLECLARCGRLEEAVELAFGEMRRTLFREAIEAGDVDEDEAEGAVGTVTQLVVKSTQAPVKDRRGQVLGPDAKTLGTLLRFAAKERDRRQKQLTGSLLSGPTSDDLAGARGRGTSIWHTLRARIREELSWLYPHVKHIGEDTAL